jgi:hypothetical protein
MPTFGSALTHVLNRVPRRHRVAALQEKDDLRIVRHELFDPRIVATAEDARELIVNFFDDRHRAFHRAGALELQRWTLLGHDLRPVRHRVPRVQRIRVLVRRQEFVHLPLVRQLHVGRDVRDEEAVLTHHLRQQDARVLANPERHQMVVERFLRIAGPPHQPAHVARRERIGVLRSEVAGRIERPIGNHHLHRHPAARDRRVQLVREVHADARAAL